MNADTPALRPLTSFRFFAALAVFVHHVPQLFNERPTLAKLYKAYFYEGYAGVTFFFVLSGFILTYNYQACFSSLKPREIWTFYVARAARIYPVHLLSFFVVLLVMLGSWKQIWSYHILRMFNLKAVTNLTLTQSFIPASNYYFSFNAPSWSLSDECFFYAALPLLLWVLAFIRLCRPVRATLLGVALWSFALGFTWINRSHPHFHWLCYINPLFRLVDFVIGVTACLVFLGLQKRRQNTQPGVLSKVVATGFELVSLAFLGTAVAWASLVPFAVRLGAYYTPCMALVIMIFAFQGGYLSRLLSARVFLILGEVSFAFYMFHQIVINHLTTSTTLLRPGHGGPLTKMGITLAVIVAVSCLCHYCYERPMRTWMKWLLQGRRKDRSVTLPLVTAAPRERTPAA